MSLLSLLSLLGVLTPLTAVLGAEVRITTGTPQPDCPPVAAVAAALGADPELARSMSQSGATLFYADRGGTAAGARALIVEIRDRRGEARLTRSVEVASGGCPLAHETIALIVERFFRELGASGPRAIEPEAPEPNLPAVVAGPTPQPSRRPGWSVLIAGGLGYRGADGSHLAPLLGGELRHAAGVGMFVDLFPLPVERQEVVANGAMASSSTWSLMLGAGPSMPGTGGPWRLSVMPSVLLGLDQAEGGQSPLLRPTSARRLTTALGGRLAVGRQLWKDRKLEVSLAAALVHALTSPTLRVATVTVLPSPDWQFFLVARVGYSLGP